MWGILATATHAELSRLHDYARDGLGGTYLPEAVLAESFGEPPLDDSQPSSRGLRPALCYIAPDLKTAPAASDYIDRIAEPARKFGFPDWYVARIDSFRVGGE